MPDKTEKKQGTRFQKGQSGNPSGRPKGSLNNTTLAAQTLLNGEAETLTRKCVEMALNGDASAMRLCIDRIIPKMKESPVSIDLPKVSKKKDMFQLTSCVLEAAASGEITLNEAKSFLQLAEYHLEAIENKTGIVSSFSELARKCARE